MKYNFWGWEQANIRRLRIDMKGYIRRLIYMMRCHRSGARKPVRPECGRTGRRKTRRWGSVPLRRFWRRIFLEDRCTVFCVREETIIVIMW